MILDIVLVAIATINVMICFKKGFTRSLFNMFSAVVGIVAAILLFDKFSVFVKNSKYGMIFTDKIEAGILNHYNSSTDAAINNSEIPAFLKGFMDDGAKSFEGAVAMFAERVSAICITVIAVILLIVIIKLSLFVMPKLLKAICKLPVIKQFDKLTGAIFGILSGVLWCVAVVYILGFLSKLPQLELINTQLDTSFFVNTFKGIV